MEILSGKLKKRDKVNFTNAHLAKPIDAKLLFKTLSGFIENK